MRWVCGLCLIALAVTGCGGDADSGSLVTRTDQATTAEDAAPETTTASSDTDGAPFSTTGDVIAALTAKGFELRDCGSPEPTVVSERGQQCRHAAADGADEAVAIDVYASDEQQDMAREYTEDTGAWASTFFGDGWSVSTQSRATGEEVERILGDD